MPRDADSFLAADFPEVLRKIRERTPARILVGRAGAAYRTSTQLELREAHAAARDAVRAELDLESVFGAAFIKQWNLFEVCTEARSKEEYLLQPDLGRRLNVASRQALTRRCTRENDIQFAIGDGLSVTAIAAQVPSLLPLLDARSPSARLDCWQSFCDSPLSGRHAKRNRRIACAESRGAADRRASGSCHCGEFICLHGVPS